MGDRKSLRIAAMRGVATDHTKIAEESQGDSLQAFYVSSVAEIFAGTFRRSSRN